MPATGAGHADESLKLVVDQSRQRSLTRLPESPQSSTIVILSDSQTPNLPKSQQLSHSVQLPASQEASSDSKAAHNITVPVPTVVHASKSLATEAAHAVLTRVVPAIGMMTLGYYIGASRAL